MFLKVLGGALPLMFGALYMAGGLNGPAYSQDIDRPPEQVAAALGDIDLNVLPTGAGGMYQSVPPITMSRTADKISWTVMSGDEVAMTMTASLTPLDGGRRTRVTGIVEKGSLSNPDSVSPAFQSPGTMEKLFSMALGAELAEFTAAGDPNALAEARKQKAMASGLMVAGQVAANPEAVKKDMEAMSRAMGGGGPGADGRWERDGGEMGVPGPPSAADAVKPSVDLSKY